MKKLWLAGFLFVSTFAWAGDIDITAKVDKTDLYIGEEINYTVKITGPSLNCVGLIGPSSDEFSPFIVKKESRCKVTNSGLEKQYVLTVFRLGKLKIPSLKFLYSGKEYKTSPIEIMVKEILPKDVSKVKMRDIKGMWLSRFPWGSLFLILLLLLILVAAFAWYWAKGKKQHEEEIKPRPYWEVAKDRITALGKKSLIELGHYQAFYYELTEILRYYLQHRYGFAALEMTNTELLQYLKNLPIEESQRQRIKVLIERSGPIKYARMSIDDKKLCYEDLEFVKNLIQPEEAPKEDG